MERSHQLAQLELVVELARLAGGAGDGEDRRGTGGNLTTIEPRILRCDRASASPPWGSSWRRWWRCSPSPAVRPAAVRPCATAHPRRVSHPHLSARGRL